MIIMTALTTCGIPRSFQYLELQRLQFVIDDAVLSTLADVG